VSSAAPETLAPRIGVLVPCRNEAAVVERKLANLERARWPLVAAGEHRLVVVDDGSEDDTAARVERWVEERGPDPPGNRSSFRASLVPNSATPGKAGAIASGLRALGSDVDVVVLTDADVVVSEGALVELASALVGGAGAPQLVCGSQRFVRDLADDGSCRGAGGAPLVDAGGRYDRLSAAVRRFESRAGRLFSVHGQLIAWRAGEGLLPRPGLAADDLDLMFAVRGRGGRVALVPGALFLERKSPAGPTADGQALRRARAYFQVLAGRRWPLGRGLLDRLQWLAYAHLPANAWWLAPLACGAGLLVAGAVAGAGGLLLGAAALSVAALSPAGRRAVRLLRVIHAARRIERRGGSTDRWEMQRT